MTQPHEAAQIKVLSGGAFKGVLTALAPSYEKESGGKLNLTFRTVR